MTRNYAEGPKWVRAQITKQSGQYLTKLLLILQIKYGEDTKMLFVSMYHYKTK